MAVGVYGSNRESDINISDIEIYYNFSPSRENFSTEFFSLDPTEVLTELQLPTTQQLPGRENLLAGLLTCKLPANIFNAVGFYTLYIRPKSLYINILDCGVLSSLPTIKGIVIDGNQIDSKLRSNNSLVGYYVTYINSDGTKLRNVSRVIVSSNKVIPISGNIGTTSSRSIRYSFDDSGNLIFLQLTPSSSSSIKASALPFIGQAGQNIILQNSFFSPICVEIEMTNNTLDSLSGMLFGNELKNVGSGELTYFDENNNIVKQFNLYDIQDSGTGETLYNVKQIKSTIDNIDFNQITGI